MRPCLALTRPSARLPGQIKATLAAAGVGLEDDAYVFSNDLVHARPWEPGLGHSQGLRGRGRRMVVLEGKGLRHYTASQLLAASLAYATPPRGSATAAEMQHDLGVLRRWYPGGQGMNVTNIRADSLAFWQPTSPTPSSTAGETAAEPAASTKSTPAPSDQQ